MDTSRLIINTIDKSSYNVEEETSLVGFTVVKAPKGPLHPVRIPAGGAAKIQDIFGVSSKEYPELFEVETFNKEYDVFVSAPYDGKNTQVNVAYVTNDGIFPGSNLINYDTNLENVILGIDDDLSVDVKKTFKIDAASGSVDVLKDYRYSYSNNFGIKSVLKGGKKGNEILEITSAVEGDTYLCTEDSTSNSTNPLKKGNKYLALVSGDTISWVLVGDIGASAYPEYRVQSASPNNSALLIKTGLPYKFFKNKISTASDEICFKIYGLDSSIKDTFHIRAVTSNGSITGEYKIYVDYSSGTSTLSSYVGDLAANVDGNPYNPTYKNISDNDLVSLEIVGTTSNSDGVITQDYIASILSLDQNRSRLEVYFVDSIPNVKVHGVICPKYPSERDIHISFSGFDSLINYNSNNSADRNILKMTVYEDGAFRNASHKLSINGSLKSSDIDTNGTSIGFIDENSSYHNQDIIYVYTSKAFGEGEDINANISKYPSITIHGGKRKFGDSEISLHNRGWEEAYDNEFSSVDVFFDSYNYSDKTSTDSTSSTGLAKLRESKFFSLVDKSSDGHNLAGYIFNYSVSPERIDSFSRASDYLSFGRNYWNVCNLAVMNLSDGSRFFSTMTGARALMQCRIIENRWGGVAPMWENEGTPGLGGQLDMINPIRLRYRYSKEQLDILDKFNYNPVINDRQYGIMVVSQKTCKPGEITDWSYIGHACAFFNFIKEIRANVMIPQIGKANNPYYRELRNKQVSQYLRERLDGDNRIWAWASVDTSTADGVNDVFARKALKFVINVSVQVDIFSERVELNFTNEDQSTSVSFSDSYEEA